MSEQQSAPLGGKALLTAMSRYEQPDRRRALWQLMNTFVPYITLWALMVLTVELGYSYWTTLALSVLAAGFLVRIFIIFHDCCHGSFFASQRANTVLGYVTGILTFTPYHQWRYSHNVHHATAGNLDRRGVGDVWTMTVDEYRSAPWWQRLAYRLVRNPLVTFGIGPAVMFLLVQRLPNKGGRKRHRLSVLYTDLALLAIVVVAALTLGLRTYLLVQLPIILLAGTVGVWLFYVQHQFESVYWTRGEDWDPIRAALEGSSFYKLPKILQWFTGNIGFHHIHHLRARIPNYRLERCFDEMPEVQAVEPLTLLASLRCMGLDLWDEEQKKLVSFRSLRRPAPQGAS